jgi:hypothetical protein
VLIVIQLMNQFSPFPPAGPARLEDKDANATRRAATGATSPIEGERKSGISDCRDGGSRTPWITARTIMIHLGQAWLRAMPEKRMEQMRQSGEDEPCAKQQNADASFH